MIGHLIDKNNEFIAVIEVFEIKETQYSGRLLISNISPELEAMLQEFENRVNNQVFF